MPLTRHPQPRPSPEPGRPPARASTRHPTRRAVRGTAQRADHADGRHGLARPRRLVAAWRRWAWAGVLAVVVLGLALTPAAQAATGVLAAAPSLDGVLTNIRNFLMGILGSVTIVCLIVAGIRYVLASGDPGEIDAAKRAFKNGLFGFALAMLAPLLVEILKSIVGS